MKMNNKVYDIAKYIALVFLPALTVFVGVVLKTLNVECATTVIIIMEALDVFLGSILGVSSINYKKEIENENKK